MRLLFSTAVLALALQAQQVDFSGLTEAQTRAALQILQQEQCVCGCAMSLVKCRVDDPNCSYSRVLVDVLIQAFRDGKTPEQARAALAAEQEIRRPKPPRLLEDPVEIPLAAAPVRGPAGARITLVEFSDFECPYCAKAADQVNLILQAYPNDIKLVYKQFPLENHSHAALAAEASLAAHAQNKFWLLHDRMFAHSRSLSRANILAWAGELGLNVAQLTLDLDSGKFKPVMAQDRRDGDNAGVSGTPTFFINGKRYNGPLEMAVLKPIFEAELKK